jgi:peptide/nickel transport system permease protein
MALFLLGVRAFLPLHLSTLRTFFLLTGVIGLIGWARPARLVRGVVLSSRNRTTFWPRAASALLIFISCGGTFCPKSLAYSLPRRHYSFRATSPPKLHLSFFGLGVNEPVPSWGNMLSALQQYSVLVSYAWLLAPACALVVTSVLYSSLAELFHSRLKSS